MLNSLKTWSDGKGYVLLEQWTTIGMREFRSSWKVAANTVIKYMEIVWLFFGFAVSNGSPVSGKATEVTKECIPFTDEGITCMLNTCQQLYGKKPIRWSRDIHHHRAKGEIASYHYKWTGSDLADFITISTYTGLRISDVAIFNIERLNDASECHVRTTKTGRKVSTWIQEWL